MHTIPATCAIPAACATFPPMRHILHTTGLLLLAFIVQGCATPERFDQAVEIYEKLDPQVVEYQPVGDSKIDGLCRPFMTSANQFKAEVAKEYAAIAGTPVSKKFNKLTPEEIPDAYAKLDDTDRKAVDDWVRSSAKADSTRTANMLKQAEDLAKAGAQLAIEIVNASKGGAGGTAGLISSVASAMSEQGQKAKAQVDTATDYIGASQKMISTWQKVSAKVTETVNANIRKAQA